MKKESSPQVMSQARFVPRTIPWALEDVKFRGGSKLPAKFLPEFAIALSENLPK